MADVMSKWGRDCLNFDVDRSLEFNRKFRAGLE